MTELQRTDQRVAVLIQEGNTIAAELANQFQGETIETQEDLQSAGEALIKITSYLRNSETERTKLVKPLNDTVRNINDMVKKAIATVQGEEGRLRRMMSVFRAKIEQQRRDEYAKAQEEVKTAFPEGSPIPETVAPIPVDPVELKQVESEEGKIHFATVWHSELVDATKVPRKYMIPDTVRVNRVVKAESGKVVIPGFRIWSTQEPVVRR